MRPGDAALPAVSAVRRKVAVAVLGAFATVVALAVRGVVACISASGAWERRGASIGGAREGAHVAVPVHLDGTAVLAGGANRPCDKEAVNIAD